MKGIILGAGYIGSSCIIDWPDRDGVLIATTTKEEKIPQLRKLTPRVEVVKGNNREKLTELIGEADFAIVTVAPKDRSKYAETYLETAHSVADALKNRYRPFYLLYTSSTSVYGNQNGAIVDEASPLLADSKNGSILIDSEKCYHQTASQSVDVCILRLGGIHGPGRDLNDRAKMLSGRTMTGRDSPTNHSSLTLITKGIAWCVNNRLTGVYNLVEDAHPTKNELYGSLLEKLNMPPPAWDQPHTEGAVVSNRKFWETGFGSLC